MVYIVTCTVYIIYFRLVVYIVTCTVYIILAHLLSGTCGGANGAGATVTCTGGLFL